MVIEQTSATVTAELVFYGGVKYWHDDFPLMIVFLILQNKQSQV